MFSHFFIERPIFAGVVSIVIMIAGGVSIPFLPVEQTPDITPPTVSVTTNYPGANAEVIAETVAQPIEEEVNGVEDMIYMFSKCGNDGSYELTVTFNVGTNIDMATVLVQNRVAIAQPKLPEEVTREGVKTEKQSTAIVLMVNLISEKSLVPTVTISGNLPDRSVAEVYGAVVRPILDILEGTDSEGNPNVKNLSSTSWDFTNRELEIVATFKPEMSVADATAAVNRQIDVAKQAMVTQLTVNVEAKEGDEDTIIISGNYPNKTEREVFATVVRPILAQLEDSPGVKSTDWTFSEGRMEIAVQINPEVEGEAARKMISDKLAAARRGLADSAFAADLKVSGAETEQYRYDELYLSNYVGTRIKDVLGRVAGVGKVNVMGAKDFGMRIWLDPNKLRARGVTTNDVVAAIREQNVQVAAGQIGAPPAPKGQEFEYTVKTLGRLSDVRQFED
ncbi:MAG: efflux RND transporter permease subunit, partial [Pirellulales bacterium]|nr:efflux RND transporter permease subunit [Pirellulales bacterium]